MLSLVDFIFDQQQNPETFVICSSDNYGFITYYNKKDAFNAIENGGMLREPNELPFDLCFGGRRQFCKSNYADLGEFDIVSLPSSFQNISTLILFCLSLPNARISSDLFQIQPGSMSQFLQRVNWMH